MTPNWYLKAVRELEKELRDGMITQVEFTREMRDLDRDLVKEESTNEQNYF